MNWRTAGKLLSVQDVMEITGLSYWSVTEMAKRDELRKVAAIRKPLRFDPEEVHRVFFGNHGGVQPLRSLKTREKLKVTKATSSTAKASGETAWLR